MWLHDCALEIQVLILASVPILVGIVNISILQGFLGTEVLSNLIEVK